MALSPPAAIPVAASRKEKRIQLIKEIQQERNSFLISYVTGTRDNLSVTMAMDSIRKIFDHIILFNKPKAELNIDLFLYSNGGDGTVPWRLVTLIREYASKFSVLVPCRAFSAATLTSLGADEILMHPMGMLGPTDPTVTNDFNPPNPSVPGQKLGISVEDVTAYIDLIKQDAGITHEDELVQAFNKLADQVHPLALGNVKRSLSQSRMMANKLLSLHIKDSKRQHEIDEIVDNLTTKLYYHGHPINREEAKTQIGLKTIINPSSQLEKKMWDLYLEYELEMKLDIPYIPLFDFIEAFPNIDGNLQTLKDTAKLAYIESQNRTDCHIYSYEIDGSKSAADNMIRINQKIVYSGWKTE